jgi:hypothetical protein
MQQKFTSVPHKPSTSFLKADFYTNMEAAGSSNTSIKLYRTKGHYSPNTIMFTVIATRWSYFKFCIFKNVRQYKVAERKIILQQDKQIRIQW